MEAKPKLNSILVVHRITNYEIYAKKGKDSRVCSLLEDNDPSVAGMLQSHQENEESLRIVRDLLDGIGAEVQWHHRPQNHMLGQFDLVVSLGGDGTLLDAAQQISDDTPLIGVNSAPSSSVGYLCTTDAHGFREALELYMQGQLPKHPMSRIEVEHNGEKCKTFALNDVLFAHGVPAATTRYRLCYRDRWEDHRSSGIWIATPAGSTAGIQSAGGESMSLSSKQLQFLIREYYLPPKTSFCSSDISLYDEEATPLLKGFLEEGEALEILPQTDGSYLYLDGPWTRIPLAFGDRVLLRKAPQPLCLLGAPRLAERQ